MTLWTRMTHPDLTGAAIASVDAYDILWAEKGWQRDGEPFEAAESVEDPNAPKPEVDASGKPVDPQRLNKVLAGEVRAEDVGVDPNVLGTPDVTPEPAPPERAHASRSTKEDR